MRTISILFMFFVFSAHGFCKDTQGSFENMGSFWNVFKEAVFFKKPYLSPKESYLYLKNLLKEGIQNKEVIHSLRGLKNVFTFWKEMNVLDAKYDEEGFTNRETFMKSTLWLLGHKFFQRARVDEKLFSELVTYLSDSDTCLEAEALLKNSKPRKKVILALVSFLKKSSSAHGRQWAAVTLEEIEKAHKALVLLVLSALEKALYDSVSMVRIAAASALGKMGHQGRTVIAKTLKTTTSWKIKQDVIWALKKPDVQDKRIQSLLISLLIHPWVHWSVSAEAATALGKLGADADLTVVKALISVLRYGRSMVRYYVSKPLAKIGSKAVPFLVHSLVYPDYSIRKYAIKALDKMNVDVVQKDVPCIGVLNGLHSYFYSEIHHALFQASKCSSKDLPYIAFALFGNLLNERPYRKETIAILKKIAPRVSSQLPHIPLLLSLFSLEKQKRLKAVRVLSKIKGAHLKKLMPLFLFALKLEKDKEITSELIRVLVPMKKYLLPEIASLFLGYSNFNARTKALMVLKKARIEIRSPEVIWNLLGVLEPKLNRYHWIWSRTSNRKQAYAIIKQQVAPFLTKNSYFEKKTNDLLDQYVYKFGQ